jgi:hypothetical protein
MALETAGSGRRDLVNEENRACEALLQVIE